MSTSTPFLAFKLTIGGSAEFIPNRYIVEFDTADNMKASNLKRSFTVRSLSPSPALHG